LFVFASASNLSLLFRFEHQTLLRVLFQLASSPFSDVEFCHANVGHIHFGSIVAHLICGIVILFAHIFEGIRLFEFLLLLGLDFFGSFREGRIDDGKSQIQQEEGADEHQGNKVDKHCVRVDDLIEDHNF